MADSVLIPEWRVVMKRKPMLLASALMLAGLSLASAKSHSISLSEPVTAGAVHLDKGQYKVTLEGTNAVFTDKMTGKSTTVQGKVQNSGAKHDRTAVLTTKTESGDVLTAIEIGGTDETIHFGGSD